jgi:hypothetical protein
LKEEEGRLVEMRKKVAASIGVPVEILEEKILPVERIYAIADHTRCLAYMLGDCIVPSNVREGYLARLVLRRTLRMMHDLGLELDLADLVDRQMAIAGTLAGTIVFVTAVSLEFFTQNPNLGNLFGNAGRHAAVTRGLLTADEAPSSTSWPGWMTSICRA